MTGSERKFVCGLPPTGWSCSRDPKHEGPCAATQSEISKEKTHIQCETFTDYQPCFGLYKEQSDAAREWMAEHDKKHITPVSEGGRGYRYDGAIGGGYTWHFTGTSLGQVAALECACGARLDVSDYDSW